MLMKEKPEMWKTLQKQALTAELLLAKILVIVWNLLYEFYKHF